MLEKVRCYRAGMTLDAYRFISRNLCPACGSGDVRARYRCRFDQPPISALIADYYKIDPAVLSEGEYRLDQCWACATLFQARVAAAELLAILYSNWAVHLDRPEEDPLYAYDMAHPDKSRDGHEIMVAAAYLGVPMGELTTLDYGMGWASWGRIAARLGCRSFGSDIAPERMEFAGRHGVTAITDEEISGRRFHFINLEQVVEHLTEPERVVEQLAGALHPGGIVKISVPSQRGMEALLGRLGRGQASVTHEEIMPAMPLEHVNCFTMNGLKALGARFGLAPVRPRFGQGYAFLKRRDSLDFRDPKRLVKELVRPIYQYHHPGNLYVWLRRPN